MSGAGDHCVPKDSVERLLESWVAVRPDLDFGPVAVISRLARLRSHIDVELAELFARHGLTAAVFGVLVTLARLDRDEGVSQRRLMEELGLTSGTVSVRMNQLAELGLVERRDDAADKRNTLIVLTPAGRELYERVVPAHLENERRLLAALDPDELHRLSELLRRLLVEFEGSIPPDDDPSPLGLTLAPAYVSLRMRAEVGLPPDVGLLVRSVEDAGAAADAGLAPGHVLTRAGGRELRSISGLYGAIADAGPSGKLEIDALEGVKTLGFTLQMGGAAAANDGVSASTGGRSARGEHVI